MPHKNTPNLPLAILWQEYRAAQQAADSARELCCLLRTEDYTARSQCLTTLAEGRLVRAISTPEASIQYRIDEADREWRAVLEHLVRTKDAVAIAPICSRADAMIKARFLNSAIADALGEPWDTVWWQLNEWLS